MSTFSSLPPTDASGIVPHAHWHSNGETGHSVQFYSDDAYLIDRLSAYFGDALKSGASAVILATEAHRNALLARLLDGGTAVGSAIKAGRYVALDAAETLAKFMRDGHPDTALFSEVVGAVFESAKAAVPGERVAAFGEMVALLWAEGRRQAALELEQLWNDLGRRYSFMLHCAYPLSGFRAEEDGELFMKICREHSKVIPAEEYTALTSDEERSRNVAQLQQKARALEVERADRESRQEELRRLGDSEQDLRKLSHRLLRVQDEERRRLGTQLHDSVGQYLAVLKMGLDILRSDNAPSGPVAKQLMTDCAQLIEKSIRELRALSYLLYPPMMDETGLQTSLVWYLEAFTNNTGIRVQLDVMPEMPRLSREIELTLFRVLQESLANVHQHSGSCEAAVVLRVEDGAVRLEVRDSGKGLSAAEPHNGNAGKLGVGLRAIEERLRQLGGTLQLTSNTAGTTLSATISLA
jgi:signal transduction histidine kinase